MEWKLFFECTRQQGAAEGAADEGVGISAFWILLVQLPFWSKKEPVHHTFKTGNKKKKKKQYPHNMNLKFEAAAAAANNNVNNQTFKPRVPDSGFW